MDPITPIFVGEHNPYGDRPAFALFDEPAYSAGGRLRRKILGVHPRTYRACGRMDLCLGSWDRERAKVRAAQILNEHAGRSEQVLVLLGRKVAEAFGLSDVPAFGTKQLLGGPVCVVLPHPSGLCREWSKPDAVSRARTAIGAACPEFPLGEAEVATSAEEDPTCPTAMLS